MASTLGISDSLMLFYDNDLNDEVIFSFDNSDFLFDILQSHGVSQDNLSWILDYVSNVNL